MMSVELKILKFTMTTELCLFCISLGNSGVLFVLSSQVVVIYPFQSSVLCVCRWSQEEKKVKSDSDRGYFVDFSLGTACRLWGKVRFYYSLEPSCICAHIGVFEILLTV